MNLFKKKTKPTLNEVTKTVQVISNEELESIKGGYAVPTEELMREIYNSACNLRSLEDNYGWGSIPVQFDHNDFLNNLIYFTEAYNPESPDYLSAIQGNALNENFQSVIEEWEFNNNSPVYGYCSLFDLTYSLYNKDNNPEQTIYERIKNWSAPPEIQIELYHLYYLIEGHELYYRDDAVQLNNYINNELTFLENNEWKWGWGAGSGDGFAASYHKLLNDAKSTLGKYFSPYNYSDATELIFKDKIFSSFWDSTFIEGPPADFVDVVNNSRTNYGTIKQLLEKISGGLNYNKPAPRSYPIYGGDGSLKMMYLDSLEYSRYKDWFFQGYRNPLNSLGDDYWKPLDPRYVELMERNWIQEMERRDRVTQWLSQMEYRRDNIVNPYNSSYGDQIQSIIGKETYQFVNNVINNPQFSGGLIQVNANGSKAIVTNGNGDSFITFDNGRSFSTVAFEQINQNEFSKPIPFARSQEQLNNYINNVVGGGAYTRNQNGDLYFIDSLGDLFVKGAGQTNWEWTGKYNESEINTSYTNGRLFLTQYLYKLDGSRQVLSNGLALTNGNWNGDRYRESYFFEGKKFSDGSYAYYNETGYDRNGTSMVEMWKDNRAYFEALQMYHDFQNEQNLRLTLDGLVLAGGVITTILSAGSGTGPYMALFGITSGTFSIGAGGAKLMLDANGNFVESDKIPTSALGGFGVAIDQMRGGHDLTYQNYGDIASTIILAAGGGGKALMNWKGLNTPDKLLAAKDVVIALRSYAHAPANDATLEKDAATFTEIMDYYSKIVEANEK